MAAPRDLILLSALLLAASARVAPASAVPPPSAYASLPVGTECRLSPDGSLIAMIGNNRGNPASVVVDLAGGPPKVFSAGDWIPRFIMWKSQGRLLGGVRNSAQSWSTGQSFQSSIFVSIDRTSNRASMINLPYAQIISMLPGDPDHILVHDLATAGGPIERVDVVNSSRSAIQAGRTDFSAYYADLQAACEGHAAQTVVDGSAPREANIFARIDENDTWHQVMRGVLDGRLGYAFAGFSARDNDLIDLLTDGPGSFHVIRAVHIATGQSGDIVAQSPGHDVMPVQRDGTLIGYDDEAPEGTPIYFDSSWQHDAALIHRAAGHARVALIDRTDDGKRALARVQQDSMPQEYWLLDRSTGKTSLRTIVRAYEDIAPDDVAPVTQISFAARDGLNIPALLTLPAHRAPGPIPFVMLPHGGPSAHDVLGFDWLAQFIASRGYGVLQPEFRGSTGFGSALQDAGLRQ